ncbi:hypothetical protein D3C78_1031780 [compost metagenome]
MKLFKLEIGNTLEYAAAESLEDMDERKADIDPQFAFLPVEITELIIPGYEITVTSLDDDKPKVKSTRQRKE